MDNNQKTSKISVPVAIVVAGALIALAVFASGGVKSGDKGQPAQNNDNQAAVSGSSDINLKPISESDSILGNPNAPLAMVVFTDLECPFCKTFHKTMQTVMETYGKQSKVSWVFRHFPLEQLHSKAPIEARATECVKELGGQEAFWDFVDELFNRTPSNDGLELSELPKIAKVAGVSETKFNTCLDSGKHEDIVGAQFQEALDAGGRGTPFTVFVSKSPLSNAGVVEIESVTANMPPDTIIISSDKMKISMSGALPYTVIDRIIKAFGVN